MNLAVLNSEMSRMIPEMCEDVILVSTRMFSVLQTDHNMTLCISKLVLLILITLIACCSVLFYYDFCLSSVSSVLTELVAVHHLQTYSLSQVLYYGLAADAFDGESDYNDALYLNPMQTLRAICTSIIPSDDIHEVQFKIIENVYFSTPFFLQNALALHFKGQSPDFIKLSTFLRSNCIPQRSDDDDGFANTPNDHDKLVVVGASSSGLLSVLSAFHSGFAVDDIIVIERRASYLRDIWFDLYDEPFYVGKRVLKSHFAFNTQISEKWSESVPEMDEIWVMRAQILERFMAKIVYLIGIDIRFNHKVTSSQRTASGSVSRFVLIVKDLEMGSVYKQHFKWLVGSDGMKSVVRKLFGIEYRKQSQIRYGTNTVEMDEIYERSLIVNFKSNGTQSKRQSEGQSEGQNQGESQCPRLELVNDKPIDPWSITFVESEVDAVFKRFYFHHCQLQILLNHRMKLFVRDDPDISDPRTHLTSKEVAYFNHLVLNVTNFYFEAHIESVQQLEREYILKRKQQEHLFYAVKNEIFLVDSTLKILDGNKQGEQQQVVFMVGDAAMTAHYRLGIGINTILDGFPLYLQLFDALRRSRRRKSGNDSDLLEQIRIKMDERLAEKALFQTTVMWLESVCNLLVFFEFDRPLDSDNMLLYERDHHSFQYNLLSQEKASRLIEECITHRH